MPDVLVVEDDRVVLDAVARLCRLEGLEVDEATSAAAATARLVETSYRLALVDLMLPDGSGLSLLGEEETARRATPMVMISGFATFENAIRSFRLGAFDFIPKPFDVAELLGVVRRGLRFGDRPRAEARGEVAAGELLTLGRHSWASLDVDGTATVGAGETFPGIVGEVERIELPTVGSHVTQGQRLVRLAGGEEVHRIWSPLSGLVVAVNTRLAQRVELIERSPFDAGWLARLVPMDLEKERQALTQRPNGGESETGGG